MVPAVGSKVGIDCNAGGAVINVDTCNIQGDATNRFDYGIRMENEVLNARGLHFEISVIGISCAQNDSVVRGNTVIDATGNSTVDYLIARSNVSGNTLTAINVGNQSSAATGLVVIRSNGVNDYSDTTVAFKSYEAGA